MGSSFADYMEQCLYHPTTGFYTSGQGAAGRKGGDFITSPEVGPLFGAVIARAIDQWWDEAGQPDRWVVIDLGAGPGALGRSLEIAEPQCRSVWELRSHDRQDGPVAPEVDGAVVIANELLDNIPFDIGVRRAGVDHRLVVDGVPPGHDTDWEPLASPVAVDVPDDRPFPIQTQAADLVRDLIERGARRVVAFDYAEPTTRALAERGGWLRTYRQHQRGEDPFVEPGAWDITADVAIDQLPTPDVIRSQADFLLANGIDDLVEEGRRVWTERAARPDLLAMRMRSRVREAEALLDPNGLGAFACVEWAGDSAG